MKFATQDALDIPADIMAEGTSHKPEFTKAQQALIEDATKNGGYIAVYGNRIRTARRLATMGHGLESSTVVDHSGKRRLAGNGRLCGAFYITPEYAAKIGYGKYGS